MKVLELAALVVMAIFACIGIALLMSLAQGG